MNNNRVLLPILLVITFLSAGLSAMVYMTTKRYNFYQAVVQAHAEYRKLRRPGEIPQNPQQPEGLFNGWIVPRGLFGKK